MSVSLRTGGVRSTVFALANDRGIVLTISERNERTSASARISTTSNRIPRKAAPRGCRNIQPIAQSDQHRTKMTTVGNSNEATMSQYRDNGWVLRDGRATRSRYNRSPTCATLSRLGWADGVYKLNSSSFLCVSLSKSKK